MDDSVSQTVEAAPWYFRVSERKGIVKLIRQLAYLTEVKNACLGQHRVCCEFIVAHAMTVRHYFIRVPDYFLCDYFISHR